MACNYIKVTIMLTEVRFAREGGGTFKASERTQEVCWSIANRHGSSH